MLSMTYPKVGVIAADDRPFKETYFLLPASRLTFTSWRRDRVGQVSSVISVPLVNNPTLIPASERLFKARRAVRLLFRSKDAPTAFEIALPAELDLDFEGRNWSSLYEQLETARLRAQEAVHVVSRRRSQAVDVCAQLGGDDVERRAHRLSMIASASARMSSAMRMRASGALWASCQPSIRRMLSWRESRGCQPSSADVAAQARA